MAGSLFEFFHYSSNYSINFTRFSLLTNSQHNIGKYVTQSLSKHKEITMVRSNIDHVFSKRSPER
uniref:Uncharacterized protein n=1 Tax=Solanum tuberosum TaxID=4113 RepID=M1AAE3_SOLTU